MVRPATGVEVVVARWSAIGDRIPVVSLEPIANSESLRRGSKLALLPGH
jgi:hypothetical protein